MRNQTDTIFALASGSLPAGIAVLRVSGSACTKILKEFVKLPMKPRQLCLRDVLDPVDGSIIDRALVVFFPGPDSFTGEDCAEFHLHGSPAILKHMLLRLTENKNIRLAEAGEFTRRALQNGQLDLSEVEGLSDLLEAETEDQRVQAIARLGGGLSKLVEGWRVVLLNAMVLVESELDFSDEGDVEQLDHIGLISSLSALRGEIFDRLEEFKFGRIVREGFRVGIAGLPNVGKSSLINALSGSEAAIVTNEAGTTRDIIEVKVNFDGQLVILFDTAGIRNSKNQVEAIGVQRALKLFESCDLVLWVCSPDVENSAVVPVFECPVLLVGNKTDIGLVPQSDINICATGTDVSDLKEKILGHIENFSIGNRLVLISRVRDHDALQLAIGALDAALSILRSGDDNLELVSEELRACAFALQRLLGKVDSEDVLDALFSGFCIGK